MLPISEVWNRILRRYAGAHGDGNGDICVVSGPFTPHQHRSGCGRLVLEPDGVKRSTVLETHPSVGQAFRRMHSGRLRSGKDAPGLRLPPPPVSSWERWERAARFLRPLLAGRSLLWDEVKALVGELAEPMEERELRAVLQTMCLTGMAFMLPGVEIPPAVSRWRCNRCGTGPEGLFRSRCGRCGSQCVSCDRCLFLGRSRACTPLFFFFPEEKREACRVRVDLRLPALTAGQKWVADRCLEAVRSGEKRFLVWAVAGSGKTEAVLPAVHRVLEQGGHVLWVSPRRDVVEELAPRLERAFPDIPVSVLHGESGWIRTNSPLTAATAHQAWRFYRRFQLVVVDEADAFPMKGDPPLGSGVERAAAEGGTMLWLTATPPEDWRRRLQRGQIPGVILPVRHHGRPLPEPRLFRRWRLWSSLEEARPLPPVTAFLERVAEKEGQGLLFVPRVADVDRLLAWIKKRHPDRLAQCRGVTGREKERKGCWRSSGAGKSVFSSPPPCWKGALRFPAVTCWSSGPIIPCSMHPLWCRSPGAWDATPITGWGKSGFCPPSGRRGS